MAITFKEQEKPWQKLVFKLERSRQKQPDIDCPSLKPNKSNQATHLIQLRETFQSQKTKQLNQDTESTRRIGRQAQILQ